MFLEFLSFTHARCGAMGNWTWHPSEQMSAFVKNNVGMFVNVGRSWSGFLICRIPHVSFRKSNLGYGSASLIFQTVSRNNKMFAKWREALWITTRQAQDHGQAMAKPWFHASLVPAQSPPRYFAKLFLVKFKMRLDD